MGRLEHDLRARLGVPTWSRWQRINQAMIDRFADLTDDHQFIHVDVARASASPLGGTIAHGFLTLSLLSQLRASARADSPSDTDFSINYGIDTLRFRSPVRAGVAIRAKFTAVDAFQTAPGQFRVTTSVEVEIEGEAKPALSCRWITLLLESSGTD